MDLRRLFTTRKCGITLDELIQISISCICGTTADQKLFPTESVWTGCLVFVAGWIVGFILYMALRTIVVSFYDKKHPKAKGLYDDLYDEFGLKK